MGWEMSKEKDSRKERKRRMTKRLRRSIG